MATNNIDELFAMSQFEDTLRELRTQSAGSPNEVRELVGQLLQNPHLNRIRREMIGPSFLTSGDDASAQTSSTSTTRPATTSTSIVSRSSAVAASMGTVLSRPSSSTFTTQVQQGASRLTTVHDEVRRAFTPPGGYVNMANGPHRVRQARRSMRHSQPYQTSNKKRKGRTVSRNVLLLNCDMTTIPSKKEQMYHHKRIVNCVQVTSTMTAEEIETKIEDMFWTKLQYLDKPRFHFVKIDRSKVFPPLVENTCVWDGERLLSLIGSGHIYVMANGPIPDGFDASLYMTTNEVESCSSGEELPTILPEIQPVCSRRPLAVQSIFIRPAAAAAGSADQLDLNNHNNEILCMEMTMEDEIVMKEDIQRPEWNGNQTVELVTSEDVGSIIQQHNQNGSQECKDIFVSRMSPFRSFCRAVGSNEEMANVINFQVKFFDSLNTMDDGGPRRDFLHRLLREILSPSTGIFVETPSKGVSVTHNAANLDRSLYHWAGRALALVVLSGGPSAAVLSPGVYDFIIKGYESATPSMADIPSKSVRDFIEKIEAADSDSALRLAIDAFDPVSMEDGSSILLAAGISTVMTLVNVPVCVKRLIKYYALGMCRSELEDLMNGLKSYKFLQLLQNHPTKMRSVLVVGSRTPVTGAELIIMFRPIFSEDGSNQRQKEEDMMELWTECMTFVDQGQSKVSAPQILRFASGVEEVPLIGWGNGKEPSLLFDSQPNGPLPTSSTCGPTIIIPLWNYTSAEHFKENMDLAVECSPSILRN